MRRAAVLVGLVVALTGPLFGQARAADGLAHALDELGRAVLESGEEAQADAYDSRDLLALTAASHSGIDPDLALSAGFAAQAAFLVPPLARSRFSTSSPALPPRPRPGATAQERRAWLQIYLF